MQMRADARAMHRRMASGRPTGAACDIAFVRHGPDKNGAAIAAGLGVTLQAEIIVSLNQHLGIDRAVRDMAGGATFPERFVFENMRFGLFTMTGRARTRFNRDMAKPVLRELFMMSAPWGS